MVARERIIASETAEILPAASTSASLVNITPSALYFKSTEGKNGTFTPEFIYLYPRFQTVTYAGWQYSTDGGITWNNASGANGLTIGNYNDVEPLDTFRTRQ